MRSMGPSVMRGTSGGHASENEPAVTYDVMVPGFTTHHHQGVDVVYWSPSEGEAHENFGDVIGPLIVAALASEQPATSPARLLSVGSILHAAERGDVVWGTGLNAKLHRPLPRDVSSLDVRAVRGPLTRAALVAAGVTVPTVFGDPALLLPRAFPHVLEWTQTKTRDVTVIPNLNDLAEYQGDPRTISPLEDVWTVVRAIAESSLVVGSSLHALVIADALGVPGRWVAAGAEHPFKYRDYLRGTGRADEAIAASVQEAIALGGVAPAQFDADALIAAFPRDLWGGERAETEAGPSAPLTIAAALEWCEQELSRVDIDGKASASAIANTAVLPGLTRYSDAVAEPRLRDHLSAVTALMEHGVTVSRSPWANVTVAEAAQRGDTRYLRRLSLGARSGDKVRAEHVRVDARSLTVLGLATVAPGHTRGEGCRVVLTSAGSTQHAKASVTCDASIDEPSARWAAHMGVDALKRGSGRYWVRLEWHVDGKWHSTGPALAPPGLPAVESLTSPGRQALAVGADDEGILTILVRGEE